MEFKKALLCVVICVFALTCTCSAFADDVVKDRVNCFTTWDSSYLYLAFKVDSPDVESTHSKPNADITGDDSVEFFMENDNKHSEKITPACFSMAVSASGGSLYRMGNDQGILASTPVYTFKYGATVQGTINNSDDIDIGYTIEVAIPWDLLKRDGPEIGDMMSFNIIVRRHGAKPNDFVSLSPRVKNEEDALDPAKWANIVFTAQTFGVATTSLEKIISAKYVVRSPLIDGNVSAKEWNRNTSFALDLPMPAGVIYEAKFPVHRTVLGKYYYWYQADPRKTALIGGSSVKTGPWLSYDRVQWHKEELAEMVGAGIDVVLPVYKGDKASRTGYAAKGLDCLVSALGELRAEGKPYPLVAMQLDTSSMETAYGSKPDLKNEEVKRSLYGMIKNFFDRIPPEYRAVTQADKPRAGQLANIVSVSPGSVFSNLDSGFIKYCDERFESDFGLPLVWLVSDDMKGKVNGFDGIASFNSNVAFDGSARITIGEVKGNALQQAWDEMIKKNPQWIVYDAGKNVQDGIDTHLKDQPSQTPTALVEGIKKFVVTRDYHVRYLRYSIPKVIPSKGIAQAEITIRNNGNSTWRLSDGFAIGYRWYKSGRYFGESKVRRLLDRDVPSGDTISVAVGIATVDMQGNAIPDGNYEIRIELIRMSDNKWFSALGDQPLMSPITVGTPADWDATYLSCNAPVMLAGGADYSAVVRVRNDGSISWSKGIVKLGCRLYKVSNYTHDNPADLNEEVRIKDIRAQLDKDCKPGEIAEFSLDLNLTGADRKPLETWKQGDPWSYQLRFDIFNGQKWLSELDKHTYNRNIDIFENDYGPRIVDADLPVKLAAGQTVNAKVLVRNNGIVAWNAKKTKIGYHWYHLDGTEVQWDGILSPIPIKSAIQPGWPMMMQAKVQAPQKDGQYVLVWDMNIDDKWLSINPLSRGGDILPMVVEVSHNAQ